MARLPLATADAPLAAHGATQMHAPALLRAADARKGDDPGHKDTSPRCLHPRIAFRGKQPRRGGLGLSGCCSGSEAKECCNSL